MSILEVLFAMYYLTLTVLAVLNLFQAALQGSMKTDQRLMATAIAEKHLARLRVWAMDPGNFADWSVKEGVTTQDDEHPSFQVTSSSEAYQQYSPCSSMEQDWPADNQRRLGSTLRKVKVSVQWQPLGSGNRVSLTSLIAAPPRELDSVVILPGTVPNPVGKDGTASFQAQGLDTSGDPIPDLFFEWWVRPATGNGSLTGSRSGANCTFQHRYEVPPSTVLYYPTGSACEVEVRAVYRGLEKTARYSLNLSDP